MAKDVSASRDVVVDLFERIEFFFKRLESYTDVTPTAAMTDIIVKIMVEVLIIFAIATKEMKQGRGSEFLSGYIPISTQLRPERFLKRLAGRTDIEDALKRLDKLTQEEARMALAEVFKISHTIREVVISGEHGVSGCSLIPCLTFILSDGKEAKSTATESKLIFKQTASSIDKIKCPWPIPLTFIIPTAQTYS